MDTTTLIWLLPVPPLLAFFLIVLFTNRSKALSTVVALTGAGLSFIGSMVVFFRAIAENELGKYPFELSIPWLPMGEETFSVGVLVDPLSAVTLFFVAICVLMIFIYSVGYHNFGQPKGDHDQPGLPPHGATVDDGHGHKHTVLSIEPMYSRFFAFISLFAFGMLLLVVSDNLLTLFVGWEIMGLCSYLLIGFWYGKPSARAAMIKAFITTRIGDVFMLLGIVYLYSQAGTLNFREILFNEEMLHHLAETPSLIAGLPVSGLVAILLFIGTVGKSAQFPLHVWLPDAMEGPTPVSAMIHAAAMVSAGVYAVLRMFPLITADFHEHGLTATMTVIAIIGTFTAIFAATIALAQNDIKRVLAYSTISQLGFMIAAVGMGAFVAAAFHLVTHAFFKALLFLGSGSVIHGMEHGVFHTGEHVDPQDMRNMGGLRNKMPVTFWTFLIGGFSLAGFPLLTAGFWSKDEILADAWIHHHYLIFGTLALAALLTAFYTMRQITLTFLGEPRTEAAKHAHETPWTMTLPLAILAIFAISAGWVGIPVSFPVIGGLIPHWFKDFVGTTLLEKPAPPPFDIVPLATSILVSLVGLGLGYWVYRTIKAGQKDPFEAAAPAVFTVLQNKYYFDELYDRVFVKPVIWLSEVFTYLWVDRGLIDGILHAVARLSGMIGDALRNYFEKPVINDLLGDGVANVTRWFGLSLKVIQTGRVQQYMIAALVIAFGALVFFLTNLGLP